MNLDAIDASMLTPIVRRALRSQTVQILDWRVNQIHGGAGGGAGQSAVYRLAGQGRVGLRPVAWSVILKVLNAGGNIEASASHYWRREVDAYQSGLLDSLPPGLAAPRCFGIVEQSGESCWLWLEDVAESKRTWPLDRYGLAARHLGRLSGLYLVDKPIPNWSWLSSGWIRQDLAQIAAEIGRLTASFNQPLVRRFFPGDADRLVLRLWAERETFLTALERLPQTLCHFDAFRRNMFARRRRGRDETVLIDWAFVGRGPVGADIVSLVWVSLAMWELDVTDAEALDRVAFGGFLRGLQDVGWHGDPQQVRLGFAAAIALRRLGTFGYVLPWILDPNLHAQFERVEGHSIGESADQFALVGKFVEKLADEARGLMKDIS